MASVSADIYWLISVIGISVEVDIGASLYPPVTIIQTCPLDISYVTSISTLNERNYT